MKINAPDTNFMVSIRSCKRFLRYGARFVCFVKYHFFKIFQNSSQRSKFPLKTIQVKINAPDTNFIVSIRSCKQFLRYGARFVCFVKYHFFKIFQNSSQRGKFPLKTILIVSIRSYKRFLRYGARFVCFVKYHFFKIFQNSSQRGKFPLKTILTSENQCPRHEFHSFESILLAVFEIWSSFRLFR